MKQAEPRPCRSSLVLIGRNSRGNWVAQEKNGLFGGLFINRTEAIRYALFENGRHPEAIIAIPTVIELNMSQSHPANPPVTADTNPSGDNSLLRRVA